MTSPLKERPILFSAPMVRAILAGTKTQTRRVCKNQPYPNGFRFYGHDFLCHNDYLPPSAMLMDCRRGGISYQTSDHEGWESECPYGQPGDRLWVREAWARTRVAQDGTGAELVVYREGDNRTDYGGPWKPGIHMFRRDSRITLEITGVRVERLQEISHTDACAEGAPLVDEVTGREVLFAAAARNGSYRLGFRALWESINGSGSWDANPWVWVVEFRRLP